MLKFKDPQMFFALGINEGIKTQTKWWQCIPTPLSTCTLSTYLLDCLHGWWRILVTAKVDHDPSDIAEEGYGDGGTDEGEQGLHHTQADHIISALRAITWKEHTDFRTEWGLISNAVPFILFIAAHLWCFPEPRRPVHTHSGEESEAASRRAAQRLNKGKQIIKK